MHGVFALVPLSALLLLLAACAGGDDHREDRVTHRYPGGETVIREAAPPEAVLQVSQDDERTWRALRPDERPGKAVGVSYLAADARGAEWVGLMADPGTPTEAVYRVPRAAVPEGIVRQIESSYPRQIELRWDRHGRVIGVHTR